MDDREMLEWAAKAFGHDVFWPEYGYGKPYIKVKGTHAAFRWSPLTDDGDALRLAVKLNMGVEIMVELGESRAGQGWGDVSTVKHEDDPYAATRRAIVRAAAEIGKEGK